jgi:hypothetical protein
MLKQMGPDAPVRQCDFPDCQADGAHRAPRSRDEPSPRADDDPENSFWFCAEHARGYNRAWDYFSGMSREEIEAFQKADVTGHRPTWPFGSDRHRESSFRVRSLDSIFSRFADAWSHQGRRGNGEDRSSFPAKPHEQALAVLELEHPVDRKQIKRRYKELVKRHHPDANGGDKDAEERLKMINQAYTFLKTNGHC